MGLGEIERDQPAHGMAEGDDRQTRMTLADQGVDGGDIGDHLRCAVPGGKGSGDRIRGAGGAMAAVVMDIDVIAAGREKAGETLVARGVFCETVIDLHHGARCDCCRHVADGQGGAGGA
jgi:hypothetical protein